MTSLCHKSCQRRFFPRYDLYLFTSEYFPQVLCRLGTQLYAPGAGLGAALAMLCCMFGALYGTGRTGLSAQAAEVLPEHRSPGHHRHAQCADLSTIQAAQYTVAMPLMDTGRYAFLTCPNTCLACLHTFLNIFHGYIYVCMVNGQNTMPNSYDKCHKLTCRIILHWSNG